MGRLMKVVCIKGYGAADRMIGGEMPKPEPKEEEVIRVKAEKVGVTVVSKIDLVEEKPKKKKAAAAEPEAPKKKTVKKKVEEVVEEVVAPVEEVITPVVEMPVVEPEAKPEAKPEEELYRRTVEKLEGPKIMGRIELPVKEEKKKPVASSNAQFETDKKKKRKPCPLLFFQSMLF